MIPSSPIDRPTEQLPTLGDEHAGRWSLSRRTIPLVVCACLVAFCGGIGLMTVFRSEKPLPPVDSLPTRSFPGEETPPVTGTPATARSTGAASRAPSGSTSATPGATGTSSRPAAPGQTDCPEDQTEDETCEDGAGSLSPGPNQPSPTPSPRSGNDPRFANCQEAQAAGYGDYVLGRDPEYFWYPDTDLDGRVCES